MSLQILQKYLPENTLPFLRLWFADYYIHIHISRNRESKLGDYRKMPDKSHKITLNSTLPPYLFFFVLTHELAHLHTFENFGRYTAPHGKEWKRVFREMLLESLEIYPEDLQIILRKFSKSPKANFMASDDLVRYFESEKQGKTFIESLNENIRFVYKEKTYIIIQKRKKNYLCECLDNGKKYIFKPLVQVVIK